MGEPLWGGPNPSPIPVTGLCVHLGAQLGCHDPAPPRATTSFALPTSSVRESKVNCERAGVRPASADMKLCSLLCVHVHVDCPPLLICFGSSVSIKGHLYTNTKPMASAAAVAPEPDAPVKIYAAPQFTPGLLLNLRAIGEKDDDEMLWPDAYPFNARYRTLECTSSLACRHLTALLHDTPTPHTASTTSGPKVTHYGIHRVTYDDQSRVARLGIHKVTRDAAGVVTRVGIHSHKYDDEGRLIKIGSRTLQYNEAGLLVKVGMSAIHYTAGEEGNPDAKPIRGFNNGKIKYDDQGRVSSIGIHSVAWGADGRLRGVGIHRVRYEGDPPATCCIIL